MVEFARTLKKATQPQHADGKDPAVTVLPPAVAEPAANDYFQERLLQALQHEHVKLSPEQRSFIETHLRSSPDVTKLEAQNTIASKHFGCLSGDEQFMLLTLFGSYGNDVATPLRELVDAIDPVSKGPLLQAYDRKFQTVLDHLHALATAEKLSHNYLNNFRKDLIVDVVRGLAQPTSEISQSSKATCVPAGVAKKLACENPTEYSRIIVELALSGRADLPGQKQPIPLHQQCGRSFDALTRSTADSMLQNSFMELANGTNYNYDSTRDKHLPLGNSPRSRAAETSGLQFDQAEHLLEAVTGQPFAQYTKHYPGPQQTIHYLGQHLPGLIPCCIDTDGPRAKDGVNQNHFVLLTKIENGRIYYLNSYKGISAKAGTEYQDNPQAPTQRLEDPASSLMSISLADFSKAFEVAYLPAASVTVQNSPRRQTLSSRR